MVTVEERLLTYEEACKGTKPISALVLDMLMNEHTYDYGFIAEKQHLYTESMCC